MIDDLRSRFMPRFVEASRGRLERARVLFAGGDAPMLAHELHALAGEAMMLDLHAIADNARRGESAAIAWSKGRESGGGSSEAPRAVCADSLESVGRALALLSNVGPTPGRAGAP